MSIEKCDIPIKYRKYFEWIEYLTYEKLSEKNLKSAVNFLSQQISQFHPMTQAVGVNVEEMHEMFRLVLENSCRYTWIAENTKTKKIAAILVGNEIKSITSLDLSEVTSQNLEPINHMFSTLENNFLKQQRKLIGRKVFYAYALCGSRKYEETFAVLKLMSIVKKNIEKLKFTDVVAISSTRSIINIITGNHEFKEVQKIWFNSFEFQGKKPFRNIQNTQYCALFHRTI